jgi:hypothetical protein
MKKLLPLLPLITLVGCASMSSYQEARTLEAGKAQTGLAYTGYTDAFDRKGFQDSTGFNSPLVEWAARVGVWKNIDVGVKFTFIGAVAGDVKYQLMGADTPESPFQLSTGLKVAYANVLAPSYRDSADQKANLTDITVPVYATYEPVSWVGLTLAPQFTYRLSNNDNYYPAGAILGANADLRLGKSYGIMGEVGYHKHLSKDFSELNYGAMLYAPIELGDLVQMLF